MRVISARVSNFGSYRNLEFSFDSLGLTLVSGGTGSGKSTLLDIVPWCLFGQTAKNGAADDVCSWQAEEATTGQLLVSVKGVDVSVHRIRGGSGKNDLFWIDERGVEIRGKDLNDTQKLLEQRLGVSAETFLLSTYFHEFSSVGSFFTAPARSRRELFDRICALSFPTRLSAAANDLRKRVRSTADAIELEKSKLEGRVSELDRSQVAARVSSTRWEDAQREKINRLKAKAASFESDKVTKIASLEAEANAWIEKRAKEEAEAADQIQRLRSIVKNPELFESNAEACSSCGAMPPDFYDRRMQNDRNLRELERWEFALEESRRAKNPIIRQIEAAVASENTYVDTLKVEQLLQNPFLTQYAQVQTDLEQAKAAFEASETALVDAKVSIQRLTRLIELSGTLRGELLRKSVREIESQTNAYLEKYFDAEIRVGFTVADADSLDVSIHKSGYLCSYKQLSRGQRSLLRLGFSVSVMKAAANAAGVSFNLVTFDEVLDGLSVDLKVKAVALFESLATERSTVLVVDHATEVKAMFTRSFQVELVGDVSQILED